MVDHAIRPGVAVWIALRRAHQGGVVRLGDCWLDSGRPVPGYVAEALDGLIWAGLLALADTTPDPGGLPRVRVTDSGSAWYMALCQVHNPSGRAAVGIPRRWALSPYDQRAHLLAQRDPDQIGVLIAVCGHRMLWSVPSSAQPTGSHCPTCQALSDRPLSAPPFSNSPGYGRPPVEQRPSPAVLVTHAWLAGSELYDWIALRRVSSGGVAMKAGRWFDASRRIPGYIAAALAELRDAGLVMVIDTDGSGLALAALTDAGTTRYGKLCQQRQRAQQVAESMVAGPHGMHDAHGPRLVTLTPAGCTPYANGRSSVADRSGEAGSSR